ncbi:thermostable carboxypeptidase 1 [Planococcus antarcticus DSM 14505]|uniref:Thermostable carboxypeptidase 1 n=1 Tax=Planococcus antarcticus DSM 14505 TaxID=1185653 RepID=A0AA87IPA7_9BACL|nr:thermostable carboxypeptidase 1 [Planococcus antarcticus DSM 14505]
MNVQSIVSRTVDPQQSAVVTVGKMVVGTRFNIIAENAEIEGTARCDALILQSVIILKSSCKFMRITQLRYMEALQKLTILEAHKLLSMD